MTRFLGPNGFHYKAIATNAFTKYEYRYSEFDYKSALFVSCVSRLFRVTHYLSQLNDKRRSKRGADPDL